MYDPNTGEWFPDDHQQYFKYTVTIDEADAFPQEEGTIYWDDVSVDKQRQTFHGDLVWLAHRTGLKGDLTLVENSGTHVGLAEHRQTIAELGGRHV